MRGKLLSIFFGLLVAATSFSSWGARQSYVEYNNDKLAYFNKNNYGSPQGRKALGEAYETMSTVVNSPSATPTEKQQATMAYEAALRNFETDVRNNKSWYQKNRDAEVASLIKRNQSLAPESSPQVAASKADSDDNPITSPREPTTSGGTALGAQDTKPNSSSPKPIPNFRSSEEKSMKSYRNLVENADSKNPRCLYSGFAISKTKDGKCRPIKSVAEARAMGIKLVGIPNQSCGSGRALCNPLVYGLGPGEKIICVAQNKEATQSCEKMRSKSGKSLQKILANSDNFTQLTELDEKVYDACMERDRSSEKVFSENLKLRSSDSSKEDFEKTCERLKNSLEIAGKAGAFKRSGPVQNSVDESGTR